MISDTNGERAVPRVSIVITAHDRRKYLLRALRSVFEQSRVARVPEVVLVKDFDDELIDEYVRAHGVQHILVTNTPRAVGRYLADGIKKSSGEVISFLDDDDSFLPGKISAVEKVFASNPNICYYHNGHLILDDNGRSVHSLIHRSVPLAITLTAGHSRPRLVRRIVRNMLVTNLSSVSVRRKVLLPFLDKIRNLNGGTDYMMFYMALASMNDLVFGSEVLSTYYIHQSSMRPAGPIAEAAHATASLASAQMATHAWGESLFRTQGAFDVASGLGAQWEWLVDLMNGEGRRKVLVSHLNYISRAISLRPRFVTLSLPIFLCETISPRLGRRLFLRSRSWLEH